jgi:hypothetical protein
MYETKRSLFAGTKARNIEFMLPSRTTSAYKRTHSGLVTTKPFLLMRLKEWSIFAAH